MRIGNLLAVLALTLAACGGDADEPSPSSSAGGEDPVAANQNAPPPEPYVPPPSTLSTVDPGQTSPERPLPACGPVDSYRQVSEYRCRDGSQPLGGDPGLGAQARRGNVGANSRGHVIDLYVIPCPEGAVELYVDMYGCPEMEGLLGR
ncbi:MAG: hypothetical protein KC619_11740 [Myxococcales bacterium]|nr:hypothetical protein [Myxococcales bacterium]